MIQRSLVVALTVLALGAPAAGQSIDSPYRFVDPSMEIWAFGAAVFTDRGTIDVGPGSGYAAGIGYTLRISGPFNLDARVAYLPTDRRVYTVVEADSAAIREDPMAGLEQLGETDISLLLADASLRFDITGPRTWHRVQPYALIGVGAAFTLENGEDFEDQLPTDRDLRVRFSNGVTGHIGGGFEVYLNEQFTVRFDARDVLWQIQVAPGFITRHRVIEEEQWVQTAQLGLGLAYRF